MITSASVSLPTLPYERKASRFPEPRERERLAALEAEHRKQSGLLAKDVSQQMEQKWQQDLREMAASLRIFQSAQTVMWKEQVQNQQRVGTLMQQAGLITPAQP